MFNNYSGFPHARKRITSPIVLVYNKKGYCQAVLLLKPKNGIIFLILRAATEEAWMKIIITNHAGFEARRRNISEDFAKHVILNPQQKLYYKDGRVIVQNRYHDEIEGKEMLIRVIGIEIEEVFRVITVYKTSKIEKYWKKEDEA